MIVSPFKQISVPKTVLNEDYWKIGDVYVIQPKNGSPFASVLRGVSYMSDVRFENGVEIKIHEFNIGEYDVIKHISLEYMLSKSVPND